ncbi:MAG: Asp23/Gls24 family envelope stress response protein, partial [Treponema sp.]|nr:Asp23/Gls24 family envelope stress response protein [Treponema sp.]
MNLSLIIKRFNCYSSKWKVITSTFFYYSKKTIFSRYKNKDYLNLPDKNGNVHIAEEVVAAIAIGAAKETEGVHAVASANALPDFMKKVASRGVRVTVKDEAMVVDLFLVVAYGV